MHRPDDGFYHDHGDGILVSVYILVDCGVELFDEGIVAGLNRVGDAMLKVILEYNASRAAQGGSYGRKLNENVRAVALVLDHALYGLKMPYCA